MMRYIFLTSLVLSALPVLADESPKERIFTITISESNINVIGALLMKAPYEVSAPIIENLQKQVSEQIKRSIPEGKK